MGGKTSAKSKNAWVAKTYDRINLTVPKGRKAELQAVAERNNQSVNGFINGLIDKALEQNQQAMTPEGGQEQPQEEPKRRRRLPPGWDDDIPAEAIRRAVEPRQEGEVSGDTHQVQPRQRGPEEAVQGEDGDAGVVSILERGESNTCSVCCSTPHMAPTPQNPEQLSDSEWVAWSVQADDEPVEDWRRRIAASLPKDSTRSVLRRVGLLDKEVRELYLRNDAQSVEERQQKAQESLTRYKALLAKQAAQPWPLNGAEEAEMKRLRQDIGHLLPKEDGEDAF